MRQFHQLRVKEVKRETSTCVSVLFDIPAELKTAFEFRAGQYLTIRHHLHSEELRRSYSICTSPEEDELRIAIKMIENGKFSTFANKELQIGEILEVMPPQGGFTIDEELFQKKNTFVFFAAGSGITPIMSMIKHLLIAGKDSHILLFYGNRNTESIIFREDLEALRNLYHQRLSIHYILSGENPGSDFFYGRINAEKCGKYAQVFFNPATVAGFYLCGPAEMIFEAKDKLAELGVSQSKIHFELFTTEGIKPQVRKVFASYDPKSESKVELKLDGVIWDFVLPYGGSSVLDAALTNGADLPFSCKGGVCSTCKAKVLKGSVEMDINYALEPDEIEAGYVLTCQAHPRSEFVSIDFDA